jgi:acetyl-CoA hydrolase
MRAVAAQVAAVVPDEATLQFGIGALPEACLDALHGHSGLGIHSGIINDAAMRLIDAGVATGEHKTVDPLIAVAGVVGGSADLFAFLDQNPAVNLRGTWYTHDINVLGDQHRMVAINSAIEVDLTGQVNAEVAKSRYVGAIGGATDFLRGAARSTGGVGIIALPSTAGASSRIVARLSGPVSTARSDVGVIVTEYGAADLRGLSISKRVEALLAIAHPDHRDTLAAEMEDQLMNPVFA